ncbi:FAD-dependent oxidoreductase [Candidatus Gottesmanbacteria bacterium]|nr:FAD-dependent oxidoreductase [Candidatus Gottesmanbacteria bacterium]
MRKTKNKKSVVILGGGLAGLASGYELAKAGFFVTVVEKYDNVGGLARTIEKNRFRFDTGPHRWYTKNDMVNTWMLKLLGKEVIRVPRLTRIYFDKKFFDYPIKLNSTLKGMGISMTLAAISDYGLVRLINLFRKKTPITLEEGYIEKFGRTLYEMFFRRYSEKLWGTSCQNISADWIGQRTRGYNIGTIIKEILFRSKDIVSFVDEFSYPERGIGRIAEKLAEEIKTEGGRILLDSKVVKVNNKRNRIQSVIIDGKRGGNQLIADEYVNSIPISDLVASLDPKAPHNILKVNQKLNYRDEVQVVLFIQKTHITADTWIYVHSLDIPFIRFMEMDNWSDRLSPKNCTSVVFEIACNSGDEVWNKKDKDLIAWVSNAYINEFGLISEKDILGAYVHRVTHEYPVYHIGYKKDVEILKNFLGQFVNLQLVGRNGTFRYNNMDHSIEMGLYAAWNIIEGERKFDINSVNIDREYLEEKQTRTKSPEFPEDQYVEEKKR